MASHGHCTIPPPFPLTTGGGMLEDYKKIMQALSGLLKWTQGFRAEMSQLTQQSF